LAEAIRGSTDLKFGLYHSLMEWTHPLFKEDQDNKWSSQEFVKSKLLPDLHELVFGQFLTKENTLKLLKYNYYKLRLGNINQVWFGRMVTGLLQPSTGTRLNFSAGSTMRARSKMKW